MPVKFTFQHVPSGWRERIKSSLSDLVAQYPNAARVRVRRLRGGTVLRTKTAAYDDAIVANLYDAAGKHLRKLVTPSEQVSA